MQYTSQSSVELYLLSKISFNLGNTPVLLYGGILLDTTKAMFEMGTQIPSIVSADKFTPSITKPFGMTGVTLQELDVKGVFSKSEGISLSLDALATFSGINNLQLAAAGVFEESEPRLIVVQLKSSPALTLTQFITDVLGSNWSFADSVTNEFAFIEGEMYYLNPPAKAPSNYTFSYPMPGDSVPTVYTAGYHIEGKFRIFGKYDFQVDLSVKESGILLITTETTPIQVIDQVVTLKNPSLSISTTASNKYLQVSTNLSLFNTDVTAVLLAQYLLDKKLFEGEVDVTLNNVSIPDLSGSNSQNLQLTFQFQWSKASGFAITSIEGLPSNSLGLLTEYLNKLNNMGGHCAAITNQMISDLGLDKTHVSIALSHSPQKKGTDFIVPLNLNCDVKIAGYTIPTAVIRLKASFAIPTSLRGLPEDIWRFIVNNASNLVTEILGTPDTYKAIAIAAAQKGLASLAARLLCRALKEFGQKVAEDIANEVAGAAADTLAGAIELAGEVAAVALAGVSGIVSGLLDLLKKIWNWLTGSDDSKKKEAESKISKAQSDVNAQLDKVFRIIDQTASQITIKQLSVGISAQQQFEAGWENVNYSQKQLGENASLSYVLTLLTGVPGTTSGQVIDSVVINNTNKTSYQQALSTIPHYPNYQLNASISSKLSGIAVLSKSIQNSIEDSIKQLNSSGNSVAQGFATDLQNKLNKLLTYNQTGITSPPVYATLANTDMRIGQSLLGLNTIITN